MNSGVIQTIDYSVHGYGGGSTAPELMTAGAKQYDPEFQVVERHELERDTVTRRWFCKHRNFKGRFQPDRTLHRSNDPNNHFLLGSSDSWNPHNITVRMISRISSTIGLEQWKSLNVELTKVGLTRKYMIMYPIALRFVLTQFEEN
ncbi:hypothetical protein J6590_012985 [Homalodisca vitripennis]|nr:hypothetical protein J6590_012985 [Homalodisca vitripennis]